jgi:hypothetical protein
MTKPLPCVQVQCLPYMLSGWQRESEFACRRACVKASCAVAHPQRASMASQRTFIFILTRRHGSERKVLTHFIGAKPFSDCYRDALICRKGHWCQSLRCSHILHYLVQQGQSFHVVISRLYFTNKNRSLLTR